MASPVMHPFFTAGTLTSSIAIDIQWCWCDSTIIINHLGVVHMKKASCKIQRTVCVEERWRTNQWCDTKPLALGLHNRTNFFMKKSSSTAGERSPAVAFHVWLLSPFTIFFYSFHVLREESDKQKAVKMVKILVAGEVKGALDNLFGRVATLNASKAGKLVVTSCRQADKVTLSFTNTSISSLSHPSSIIIHHFITTSPSSSSSPHRDRSIWCPILPGFILPHWWHGCYCIWRLSMW